jgi:DNA-binding NtrC family response regulator
MSLGRKVLLVSVATSRALSQAIRREGYHLTVTSTFQVAKTFLANGPDLLVTELKLGDYNGLHLALRAAALGIPAIVIAGDEYQHEVEQLGAIWMSPAAAVSDELHLAMTRLLPETTSGSLADEHAGSAFRSGSIASTWSDAPGLIH